MSRPVWMDWPEHKKVLDLAAHMVLHVETPEEFVERCCAIVALRDRMRREGYADILPPEEPWEAQYRV